MEIKEDMAFLDIEQVSQLIARRMIDGGYLQDDPSFEDVAEFVAIVLELETDYMIEIGLIPPEDNEDE